MHECLLERAGAIAWVRLAAPALSATMAAELAQACAAADADAETRVVVLAGGRPGTFIDGSVLAGEAEHAQAAAGVASLARLRKPSLAVIDGGAHGVGLELALACDLRIATDSATFALPQLASGEMPFLGGTQRLARVIGRARALDMLLTGRVIDAAQALAWGLVARVAPGDRLGGEVESLVGEIAAGAPLALALAKEAVAAAFDLPLAEGMRLEEDLYALLQTTHDRAEGVRAFLEHRTPRFRGV